MALRPTRRTLLAAGLAAGATPLLPRWAAALPIDTGPPVAFSFEMLRDMARTLAEQPYVEPADPRRGAARDDRLRSAQPDHLPPGQHALGRRARRRQGPLLPSRALLQAAGRDQRARDGTARELEFSTDLFDMPAGHPARKLTKAGFAGFAVMDPDAKNDWMAVLGASYLRTSGYSGQFGMSARGLAIDSGGPGPEEFPRFTRFWLEAGEAGGIIIYALIESPRVTGAYRFGSGRAPARGCSRTSSATSSCAATSRGSASRR